MTMNGGTSLRAEAAVSRFAASSGGVDLLDTGCETLKLSSTSLVWVIRPMISMCSRTSECSLEVSPPLPPDDESPRYCRIFSLVVNDMPCIGNVNATTLTARGTLPSVPRLDVLMPLKHEPF
jgi:hypothetical protein